MATLALAKSCWSTLTPPLWQIALSIALLALGILGVVWVAARVYRVGILMYGKKPTFPEMVRWVDDLHG